MSPEAMAKLTEANQLDLALYEYYQSAAEKEARAAEGCGEARSFTGAWRAGGLGGRHTGARAGARARFQLGLGSDCTEI